MTPVTSKDTALWYALSSSLPGTEVESWDYQRRQRLVSKMIATVKALALLLSREPVEGSVEEILWRRLRNAATFQGVSLHEATRLADRATANVRDAARALMRDAR